MVFVTSPPNAGASADVGELGSIGPDESFVRFFFKKPKVGMRPQVGRNARMPRVQWNKKVPGRLLKLWSRRIWVQLIQE